MTPCCMSTPVADVPGAPCCMRDAGAQPSGGASVTASPSTTVDFTAGEMELLALLNDEQGDGLDVLDGPGEPHSASLLVQPTCLS